MIVHRRESARAPKLARSWEIREALAADGWLVFRAPASVPVADLVAMRDGRPPVFLVIEMDPAGPFARFDPDKRGALRDLAAQAGAEPFLYFAPEGEPPKILGESDWPER